MTAPTDLTPPGLASPSPLDLLLRTVGLAELHAAINRTTETTEEES